MIIYMRKINPAGGNVSINDKYPKLDSIDSWIFVTYADSSIGRVNFMLDCQFCLFLPLSLGNVSKNLWKLSVTYLFEHFIRILRNFWLWLRVYSVPKKIWEGWRLSVYHLSYILYQQAISLQFIVCSIVRTQLLRSYEKAGVFVYFIYPIYCISTLFDCNL